MKFKLVIHAGIPRTGSTSIQTFLSSNRKKLLKQGIHYPFPEDVHHAKMAWSLKRNRMTGGELSKLLLAEIEKADVPTLLLSAEAFSASRRLDWMDPVLEHFDVVVHFYLRRQDDWLMSWYNQHIKWPFNAEMSILPPKQFLARSLQESHWLNYAALTKKWATSIGPDNVRVSVFEKGQCDVVEDFCRSHDINITNFRRDRNIVNDSLPIQAIEIIRHVNRHDLTERQRRTLLIALRKAFSGKSKSVMPIFYPERRKKILARYAEFECERRP